MPVDHQLGEGAVALDLEVEVSEFDLTISLIQAAGIDGLFIGGGIHGEALGLVDGAGLDPTRLATLFDDRRLYPKAALERLRW